MKDHGGGCGLKNPHPCRNRGGCGTPGFDLGPGVLKLLKRWCPREDSNLHDLAATRP